MNTAPLHAASLSPRSLRLGLRNLLPTHQARKHLIDYFLTNLPLVLGAGFTTAEPLIFSIPGASYLSTHTPLVGLHLSHTLIPPFLMS